MADSLPQFGAYLPQQPRFRKVYFSFHYENDSRLAAQIRNSNVIRGAHNAGFADAAEWEAVERSGSDAIRRWIDRELDGTTVTAVLIGTHTWMREWVQYEIEASVARGNGLLGIHLNRMTDPIAPFAPERYAGPNPLAFFAPRTPFKLGQWDAINMRYLPRTLADDVGCYCWVTHNGYQNLGNWVEHAAQQVGH